MNRNIVYAPGVLYMQDPDRQGWHMIGEVQDMEMEIEVENPGPDVLGRVPGIITAPQVEMTVTFTMDDTVIERIWNALLPLSKMAYAAARWARRTHPHWLHLAVRAKTARTRNKNIRRILRAYSQSEEGKT